MEPRTLVLNAWMRPMHTISWQSAISLIDILRDGKCVQVGKADVLETYEATVSSPSVTVQIPAVIRLRVEVRTHQRGIKYSRGNLLNRDRNTCCYCGAKLPSRKLNRDHVVPRAQGGLTTWENTVTSCVTCNSRKGRRTPEQAGMKMHFRPHKPTTLPITMPILYRLDDIPDQWRPYLGDIARTA